MDWTWSISFGNYEPRHMWQVEWGRWPLGYLAWALAYVSLNRLQFHCKLYCSMSDTCTVPMGNGPCSLYVMLTTLFHSYVLLNMFIYCTICLSTLCYANYFSNNVDKGYVMSGLSCECCWPYVSSFSNFFHVTERARIEAQVKAAEAAAQLKLEEEMRTKREKERKAARLALHMVLPACHFLTEHLWLMPHYGYSGCSLWHVDEEDCWYWQ